MDHQLISPHNSEAEQAVIGSLLIDPAHVAPLLGRMLKSEDFYEPRHRTIYDAALTVWNRNHALDFILLTEALRKAGELDHVGGAAYITHLYVLTPTAANAAYYADTVREMSDLRTIWTTCRAVAGEAVDPIASPAQLSATLAQMLGKLTAGRGTEWPTMREHANAAIERYEAALDNRGARASGVLSSSLENLDAEVEGGLHANDLVVLAAETSGGKTALAVQISAHIAITHAAQVMVASYEMTAPQLVDRLIAVRSGVPSSKLRSGTLNHTEFARLENNLEPLRASGIHLRDNITHWTVDDVAAEARAIKAQHGLSLVVVDYLQLAAPRPAARGSQRNREREVAEISRALKGLAGELHITVIALSQLNEDGRLRESRAIGQDADVVLVINDERDAIKLHKNRHGARDKDVLVHWDGPLMKFTDRKEIRPAKVGEPLPTED